MNNSQNIGLKTNLYDSIFSRFIPLAPHTSRMTRPESEGDNLFGPDRNDTGAVDPDAISITAKGAGAYALTIGEASYGTLDAAEVIVTIDAARQDNFLSQRGDTVLDAALVALGEDAVIITGPNLSARALLVAKLVEYGFTFYGLSRVALGADSAVHPLPGPFICPVEIAPQVTKLEAFRQALSVQSGDIVALQRPVVQRGATRLQHAVTLVLHNEMISGLTRNMAEIVPDYETALRAAVIKNEVYGIDPHVPLLSVKVSHGHEEQFPFGTFLRLVIEEGWDADATRRFGAAVNAPPATSAQTAASSVLTSAPAALVEKRDPPPASPPARRKFKLTVGMATFDDFDGVYFSIQGIRASNPGRLDDVEFIVVDNNPTGPCGQALKDLGGGIPNYRYVPYTYHTSTAVRDFIFREAAGEYVLCMDCHVLLLEGVFASILDFIDKAEDRQHFYQGPMMSEGLNTSFAYFDDKVWSKGMFGRFERDERADNPAAEPFDIPMQGLGLFLCRKDAWPGINPRFRGFGGEEGYVQERVRQRGGRTLCLPFMQWLHRFPRPMGVPYPIKWEHRIRNYIIGHSEVGWDLAPMRAHFTELLGKERYEQIEHSIMEELAEPFNRFGAIWRLPLSAGPVISDAPTQQDVERLGLDKLVSSFPITRTINDGNAVAPSNWHDLILYCRQYGFDTVLLINDGVKFIADPGPVVDASLDLAQDITWDVMHFGVAGPDQDGLAIISSCPEISVVALHQRAFDRIEAALGQLCNSLPTEGDVAVAFRDALDLCDLTHVAAMKQIIVTGEMGA